MDVAEEAGKCVVDPDGVIRDDHLKELSWVGHGFGTRLASAWTDGLRTASLRQIHSDYVIAAGPDCGMLGDGDALITDQPGIWLAVRTADCVPILIADTAQRVVAAVHAGWRGTAVRITSKTVARMIADHGCRPEDMVAVIGPSIGECCYVVGAEVAAQLRNWLPIPEIATAQKVNLQEANRVQLETAGVRRVGLVRICTQCNPELLHSFRRDKERAGRMVSAIAVVKNGKGANGISARAL